MDLQKAVRAQPSSQEGAHAYNQSEINNPHDSWRCHCQFVMERYNLQRKVKQASERDLRYQSIMRNLVRRYVTVEQRKTEGEGVTEDDVNEIKQDISAFRFELIEILKNSGMNTSTASGMGTGDLNFTPFFFLTLQVFLEELYFTFTKTTCFE